MESYNCGLIIGASGGLGFALLKEMLERSPKALIYATYRTSSDKLLKLAKSNNRIKLVKSDPLVNTESLEAALDGVVLDFAVFATGVLNNPEKSLKEIELKKFDEIFKVNTYLPMIVTKMIKDKINPKSHGFMLYLSAMVGSISENNLGGWYSYRASKAALNMCVKNVSLEFSRSPRLKNFKVLSLHPGTAHTNLTEGYTDNVKHKVWEPSEAAKNILNTVDKIELKNNQIFYNWDGRAIGW